MRLGVAGAMCVVRVLRQQHWAHPAAAKGAQRLAQQSVQLAAEEQSQEADVATAIDDLAKAIKEATTAVV